MCLVSWSLLPPIESMLSNCCLNTTGLQTYKMPASDHRLEKSEAQDTWYPTFSSSWSQFGEETHLKKKCLFFSILSHAIGHTAVIFNSFP